MLDRDTGDIKVMENLLKLLCLHLVQQMLHQIKAQQFYTDLGLYLQCKVLQKTVEFKAIE